MISVLLTAPHRRPLRPQEIKETWEVVGLPALVLVDQDGQIMATNEELYGDSLVTVITQVFEKAIELVEVDPILPDQTTSLCFVLTKDMVQTLNATLQKSEAKLSVQSDTYPTHRWILCSPMLDASRLPP